MGVFLVKFLLVSLTDFNVIKVVTKVNGLKLALTESFDDDYSYAVEQMVAYTVGRRPLVIRNTACHYIGKNKKEGLKIT